jgi:hypothetical protein
MIYSYGLNDILYKYVSRLFDFTGAVSTIGVVTWLLQKRVVEVHHFLSNSSFFIYAVHGPIVLPMVMFSLWRILPHNEIGLIFCYIITPILTITIALICYYFMTKWIPKTAAILTGGRAN